jgi:hypothetical protein
MAAILVAAMLGCVATPGVRQHEDINVAVRGLLQRIAGESDVRVRKDKAEQLASYIVKLNKPAVAGIEVETVDAIADLLHDGSDLVRAYAADALGYLKERARRAVPALQAALNEAERANGPTILPSRNSIASIELAIRSIEQ